MIPCDFLEALLAEHGSVVLDTRAAPPCVTVYTKNGPRHFHGRDVSAALAQAHHALSPRAVVVEPEIL